MSSFVIGKEQYIKAAGLMYGVSSASKYVNKCWLENIRSRFVECYKRNVWSVAEQYEEKPTYDSCAYDSTFEKYCKIGKDIAIGRGEHAYSMCELREGLIKFLSSVLYQIEDEKAHNETAVFFFSCVRELSNLDIDGWWGNVEL